MYYLIQNSNDLKEFFNDLDKGLLSYVQKIIIQSKEHLVFKGIANCPPIEVKGSAVDFEDGKFEVEAKEGAEISFDAKSKGICTIDSGNVYAKGAVRIFAINCAGVKAAGRCYVRATDNVELTCYDSCHCEALGNATIMQYDCSVSTICSRNVKATLNNQSVAFQFSSDAEIVCNDPACRIFRIRHVPIGFSRNVRPKDVPNVNDKISLVSLIHRNEFESDIDQDFLWGYLITKNMPDGTQINILNEEEKVDLNDLPSTLTVMTGSQFDRICFEMATNNESFDEMTDYFVYNTKFLRSSVNWDEVRFWNGIPATVVYMD